MISTNQPIPDDCADLRILMLSDVYFPRINGVSTSIETFRSGLASHGVDARLIAPDYPHRRDTGEDCRRVPSRRLPFDPEDRLMRWRPLVAATKHAAADAHLIHIQTPFAAHYAGIREARRLRIPALATYHTHFEEYIQHYLPLLPRRMLKEFARRVARHQCEDLHAVIVPSPAMRDTLRDYGIRAPLHVLPTGVPVAHFAGGNGDRFRARHAIPFDRPIALYVGRVAHEKNIGLLIDAMPHAIRQLPDLLLVIAGEGPASASLQRRVATLRLGSHVRFVGYLDRRDALPDCYAAANVFAFASRTETQGLVLIEAMAAGLPVFALSCLGTASIVEARRGAVVAPDDPNEFGHRLAGLAGNPPRLALLAQEAKRFAEEWSAPERTRQLADLYRSLVE